MGRAFPACTLRPSFVYRGLLPASWPRDAALVAMAAPPLDDVLATAKHAALLAGEQIIAAWQTTGVVKDTKSNATDLVTETDHRCEDMIIELLQEKYPEHSIIGEETAGSSKYQLTDGPTWTIDPIDGTTNFVHRLAAWLGKR
ncbi:unnamed protein product [Prorocentrum cordatum]|uniref:Inositol-phosphate phosphatase n=1 Tax=Prorocentrum cordatum TaxID=2364126 RepID=A0ABN9W705_9DINO|nr:unnamed protein product [Polarella glacialis]